MSSESNKCGIYFLINDGIITYIGQTTNLINRLLQHKQALMLWDQVKFIACKEEDLTRYETRWIKKFLPVDNHTHKGRKSRAKKLLKPIKRKKWNMKFRKLTLKSFLDYGGYKDRTVQNMIDHKNHLDLISAYYKLSHITFFDDVLEILKITPEWRINKPGTDKEKYLQFILAIWPEQTLHRREVAMQIYHRKSKSSLREVERNNNRKIYHRKFNQKP